MAPTLRSPRGTEISCKGWLQEAALRMLHNNLDPEVAERPEDLVVYGGTGRAARSWEAFENIVASLRDLKDDETLLVQSGKPVGIARTHEDAPRVLIANSNLVPAWATFENFRDLEDRGLIMYGQMTAGSWIYIGTQGILQGTHETFLAAGRTHFGDADLHGRTILTAGLGGMGGAQPLAATMAGAATLCIEVDPTRIQRRLETRYLDEVADDLDSALARIETAKKAKEAVSVGLCANAADVFPQIVKRGFAFDLVTDQTSAHDPLEGYVPHGYSLDEAAALRKTPDAYIEKARASMVVHCRSIVEMQKAGAHVFDYGNNLRGQAELGGYTEAFTYPGFVPAYIRPLFCEGMGPFRWVALSGDPEDIAVTDEIVMEAIDRPELHRWLKLAAERVEFQKLLPSRICWLGYGERSKVGLAFNEAVKDGRLKAPIVIGRDHLDCGSVASPNRETEAMKDGSDAIADWPILNAMLNASNGATWVSFHHGGGVGIGYSLHAGIVIVADGTEQAGQRLSRVLEGDPAMGVFRHVDAGYERAVDVAKSRGVKIPGVTA